MSAIIFDFDGTIANSFDYVIGFLATEAKLPELSDEQKAEFRSMSMQAMALKLGHPWWRLPRLFFKGRTVMGHAMKQVDPFEGIVDVIQKLHAEGHQLYILSSNNVHNVHNFLHRHNLHKYFLQIYGGVGMFSKTPALRRLVKEQRLELKDCVYIGDELRDMEAARAVHMRAIAVEWGFAKINDLKRLKPRAMAQTPEDIVRIFEEI